MKRKDKLKREMVGKTFGRLKVLKEELIRDKNSHILYLCECSCGRKKAILGSSLRSGATQSCGCLQKEKATVHGKDGTPEYRAWIAMKERCNNTNSARYKDWGGRGISVCSEWEEDFSTFFKDMGSKPSSDHSLERVDNEKGYCPDNCRWATKREQASNRRNTVKVFYEGSILSVFDFAKKVGLSPSGAGKRLIREYKKNKEGIFVKEGDL